MNTALGEGTGGGTARDAIKTGRGEASTLVHGAHQGKAPATDPPPNHGSAQARIPPPPSETQRGVGA